MSTYNYPQVHLFLPVSMSFVTDFLMLCHFFFSLTRAWPPVEFNILSCVFSIAGHFCFGARWPRVKLPLREPLGPEVPRYAVMSCQLLLLYSLIVERSVSHPVRLTAGVPLVTPQCPVPADAIVAALATEERRCGPAGCETILGRKRRESRSCVQKPGQPGVCESTPLWHPPTPLPRRIDFVILCILHGQGTRLQIASCPATLRYYSFLI